MRQFSFISNLIGLIASLLSIFNVFLALPSVFKDIDAAYLINLTNKNFALKFGFILILQFGVSYILASLIAASRRQIKFSSTMSITLLLILISSWLTFFNISEILYVKKISTVIQHIGMLFFLFLTFLVQALLILTSRWKAYEFEFIYLGEEDYKKFRENKFDAFEGKFYVIGLLLFFEIILFVVYWLN